ncbi:hypothetical protein IH970_12785, partial [candidate division KSB1 bacterium]|nr:hypothetical protein [candidate division KSB1 bacterium]
MKKMYIFSLILIIFIYGCAVEEIPETEKADEDTTTDQVSDDGSQEIRQ